MAKRFFAHKGWKLMLSGHEPQLRLAKDDLGGGYGDVLAKNAEREQALQNQTEVHALQLASERLQREAGECLHEHQLGSLQREGALKDEITTLKLAAAAREIADARQESIEELERTYQHMGSVWRRAKYMQSRMN
ncbi:hypothetical protein HDU88_007298 [Geranomyces variabilis]|nr:hypothetical protein HDU88_007298 [Geranomyces variabilis]